MFKKTPERCEIQDRTIKWRIEKYMDAYKKKGVEFNYTEEDKNLFYETYEEIGSEYEFDRKKNVGEHQLQNIGGFGVLYADPPWEYRFKCNASPDGQYDILPTQKICEMKTPAMKDAVLFLWVTNPLLPDGLQVMQAWGFEYKTNIVWIKDHPGLGHYVLGQHELLLIGIKGEMGTPKPKNRPPSLIQAPRTKHSEKPKIVYTIIERMYPKQKYIELFAREPREGWVSWGNQLEVKN